MLTAYQIDVLRSQSEQLLDPVIEFLIQDIAERVTQAGQLTSTAAYEVWRAQNLGVSQRRLKKELQKRFNLSKKEVEQLLKQAAKVGYNFDLSQLPTSHAIPFVANGSIQQIVDAAIKVAQGELENLTRTMGFAGPDGKVRGLTQAYRQACDFAFEKVFTGAQDYTSAIRDATKGLAEKGIVRINYNSGRNYSLEAAVRRNIMSGLGLMQEQISQQNHDALGCDGWEISAHAASAPDHEPYQGKQYTDAEYTRLNNSLVRRIGTLNCGHSAFPIILGVNSPQYTAEELEKFRQDNEKGVDFDGKHYTLYEATQRQRLFERTIRKQKRRILVDESLGDKEQLQTDQIKLVRLQEEYKRFSDGVDLPMQYERMEMTGFNGKHGKAAETAANEVKRTDVVVRVQPPANLVQASNNANSKFMEITGKWYPDAKPNSHPVTDLQEYTVDGTTYKVDGINVVLDYKAHEKEIAELLAREVGGEIYMVPRVNNPQGVSTPDYIFNGKAYDLKTLENKTPGKNPIFNRVKKKRSQARRFIIDVTKPNLSDDVILAQIDKIFWSQETQFIDEIVIVRNGTIERVFERVKKKS